ncbi:hypothetical protein C1645_748482 [Glomus cerebriforme]|uniref:F-box domain-containing protein n=1 Tax=Glomus cerebriforme TaxID=658196 RepID=A0A397TL02_9GLOM|nr:hypothetical protein C1645_748482 [Glomus cerebriforme]
MVNRIWCETVIPILWKNPWHYKLNYCNKNYLFIIISLYLSDDVKEFLSRQGIQLSSMSHKSLSFDYLSFCKSINVNIIENIISIGSSLSYNQFLLQQEFYNIMMKTCPELKYLDIISIKHQIFYFPEAKVHLDSLCELKCDTSIDPSYFFGLARICQKIQNLIIINTDPRENDGIVKLIEFQKNLKFFEWKDNFDEDNFVEDPYEEIFFALAKKTDNLNHLILYFQFIEYYEHNYLKNVLPKFSKLKTLKIDNLLFSCEEILKTSVYRDLEIFNTDYISIETIISMIENSGGHLKEVLLRYYCYEGEDDFNEDSLILIRTIYEKCPLVEYLSLVFSTSDDHFAEFEKLLKTCQNLRSLLLIISNIYQVETYNKKLENGEKLLNILIRSAPINLREIRFFDNFKFSLKNLEEFLEKWKGRPALSILTSDPVYRREDYVKLINKYKEVGVINDFSEKNIYF